MSYIGNPIISTDFPKDTFSGNGATVAFTMSIAPASVNAVIVVVSGITQDPSTYTISGTTLTFSAAPPTGTSNISVRHLGVAGIPNVPSDASVTSAKLASGAALSNIGSSQLASANLPAGSVLQVVQTTYNTSTTINTATFTDTGLSLSITPKSATSKILVTINQQVRNAAANPSTLGCRLRLLRGSTNILSLSNEGAGQFDTFEITADTAGNVRTAGYITFSYLDSPATTSATTYKIQASTNAGGHEFQNSSSKSIITLMEIAA